MKAPSQEIYIKSTTSDFLLMFNSNHGRITYRLLCIFTYKRLKIFAIFAHCILIVDS